MREREELREEFGGTSAAEVRAGAGSSASGIEGVLRCKNAMRPGVAEGAIQPGDWQGGDGESFLPVRRWFNGVWRDTGLFVRSSRAVRMLVLFYDKAGLSIGTNCK